MKRDKKINNAYSAAYRARNRAAIAARSAAWGRANPEKVKARNTAYRAANRRALIARDAAYYEANRSIILAKKAADYKVNRERILARRRSRYRANRAPILASVARRDAAKRSVPAGDMRLVDAVYQRAASSKLVRCYLCDKRIPIGKRHVDHIVPLSRGGEHSSQNLAIACARCNRKKHARPLALLGWLPFENVSNKETK